jgi:hypothetical protein
MKGGSEHVKGTEEATACTKAKVARSRKTIILWL